MPAKLLKKQGQVQPQVKAEALRVLQAVVAEVVGCTCGGPGEESHTCPYQSDINDDREFRCNCCAECEGRCCDDI